MAHPDNTEGSELDDRINDLEDLEEKIVLPQPPKVK